MFVRSVRAQCGGARNLRQVHSGDGGIPTVAVETSSVWANLVTAAVLLLSPLDSLRRDDAGEAGAELSDEAELVHDLGDPVLPSGESSRAGPRPRRSLLRPEPCRCSSPVSHGNLGGVYCRPVLPSGELS